MAESYNSKLFKVSSPYKGVLLVEIARPPANAFNTETWTELRRVFEQISFDGDVRAVVLASANSKFFSAGLDLNDASVFASAEFADPARKAMSIQQHIKDFQNAITALEKCNQPVIAAINGYAFGLAIDMTSACDIRYACSDVQFSIKEVDIGIAADIGTLSRFPKIVGNESLAREYALTARIFGATEAREIGFVSRVVEGGREQVIEAAVATAVEIASKSPVAVVGTKHLMIHSRDHSVPDSLDYTANWNSGRIQTSDMAAALKASKSKKPTEFLPLTKLSGKL